MPNNKKVEPSTPNKVDTKKTEVKGKSESKDVKEVKEVIKKEEVKKEVAPKETKKSASKIIVEDVEDTDDEEEEESENEIGSEEEDEKKQIKEKEKKAKKTFSELTTDFEKISADIKTVESDISEIEKNLKVKEKMRNDLERQRNKVYLQMGPTHEAAVKQALKEKPKRQGNKDGGFNKEQPVPPKLIKLLKLEEGVKMSRPKIMSLVNDEFKLRNLKQGQTTKLDEATAKALGKKEGRVIEFTEFQSFLKELYQEAFPEGTNNTVSLT